MLHLSMIVLTGVLLFSVSPNDEAISALLQQFKYISRIGAFVALLVINVVALSRTPPARVALYMMPFGLFLIYAMASLVWSPQPIQSATQLFSLALLLLIAATIAHLTSDKRQVQLVLMYLVVLCTARGLMMLAFFAQFGEVAIARGTVGQFWHATDAADTASLGLILLIAGNVIGRYRWARVLLIPCGVILAALFVVAHNRLSMVLTPATLGGLFLLSGHRRFLVAAAMAMAILVPPVMVYDAHSDMTGKLLGWSQTIAHRGDDGFELATLSGRDELWGIIWDDFQHAKWFGHGYMMTSGSGDIEVWNEIANFDAHNLVLHLLASTGIFGLSLFAVALIAPARMVASNFFGSLPTRRLARIAFIVLFWLVLWGTLNVSFCAYLNASSLVFYVVIGLIIGHLSLPRSKSALCDQTPAEM